MHERPTGRDLTGHGLVAGEEPGSAAASTRRAFVLSLVYVLAMALTYTVAGRHTAPAGTGWPGG